MRGPIIATANFDNKWTSPTLACWSLLPFSSRLPFPASVGGDDSTSSPEELTECQQMSAKCRDNWDECFPREAYNGDACCQQGASFKCVEDAKRMNCILAGHPDLESLIKCIPKFSACKSPSLCSNEFHEDKAIIEKYPKVLKCLQRKHSDVDDNCMPKEPFSSKEECNAPYLCDCLNPPISKCLSILLEEFGVDIKRRLLQSYNNMLNTDSNSGGICCTAAAVPRRPTLSMLN
uniref:Uncharacterized protein n=1 Tax=Globodera rostochiensis TaxID=31243 RepID=A0A914IA79_GLORO